MLALPRGPSIVPHPVEWKNLRLLRRQCQFSRDS